MHPQRLDDGEHWNLEDLALLLPLLFKFAKQ